MHGDFWPNNLLWRDTSVVGVLDWEDAAIGDIRSDLAGAGIELAIAYGDWARERFLERYENARSGSLEGMELWEVYCASATLDSVHTWGLERDRETHVRAVVAYHLQRALSTLLPA